MNVEESPPTRGARHTDEEDSWYFSPDRSTRFGPITLKEIRFLLERNYLRATALVWRPGLGTWRPISSMPHLRDATLRIRRNKPGSRHGSAAPFPLHPWGRAFQRLLESASLFLALRPPTNQADTRSPRRRHHPRAREAHARVPGQRANGAYLSRPGQSSPPSARKRARAQRRGLGGKALSELPALNQTSRHPKPTPTTPSPSARSACEGPPAGGLGGKALSEFPVVLPREIQNLRPI